VPTRRATIPRQPSRAAAGGQGRAQALVSRRDPVDRGCSQARPVRPSRRSGRGAPWVDLSRRDAARSTVERARALTGITTHEPQERGHLVPGDEVVGARHDDATSELARKLAATHQLVGPRVACLAAATMVGADAVAERRQAAPRFGPTHAVDPQTST
jgi:hypothetical protein